MSEAELAEVGAEGDLEIPNSPKEPIHEIKDLQNMSGSGQRTITLRGIFKTNYTLENKEGRKLDDEGKPKRYNILTIILQDQQDPGVQAKLTIWDGAICLLDESKATLGTIITIAGVKVSDLDKRGLEAAEKQNVIKKNLNLNLSRYAAINAQPGEKQTNTRINDLNNSMLDKIITVVGRVVLKESFEGQKLKVVTIKQANDQSIEINFWAHGEVFHPNLSCISVNKAYKFARVHVSQNGENKFKLTASFYSTITELASK